MTSASGALLPPLGGMAPLPCSALLCSVFRPCAMRGAHAALSPNFGAPATPAAWQTKHTFSYVALPSGAEPPLAAAPGAATATVAVAGAAAGAAGAAGALGS